MPTTFKASLAETGVPARYQEKGAFTVVSTYTVPAASTVYAGDTIQMLKVQSGVTVTDVVMIYEDMSGDSDVTFAVGDGASTDRFITAADVDSAVGTKRLSDGKFPYTYTADDTIDILIGGSAGVSVLTNAKKVTLVVTMTAEEVDLA